MAVNKNFLPLADEPLVDGVKGSFEFRRWMESTTTIQNQLIDEQANQAQLIEDCCYG